jgi:hypothetical protein
VHGVLAALVVFCNESAALWPVTVPTAKQPTSTSAPGAISRPAQP